MLRLYDGWADLQSEHRQLALGAAFSLWRAVFLISGEQESGRSLEALDDQGRKFLHKVVKTNTVGFSDDLFHNQWTSGYYLNNASQRVAFLTGDEVRHHISQATLREAWNQIFIDLSTFLDATAKRPL
jgi:putative heme degradation protein